MGCTTFRLNPFRRIHNSSNTTIGLKKGSGTTLRLKSKIRILDELSHLCYFSAKSTVWYGDGTFSIAPDHFYQLYTIHGIVLGQLLPLLYCLMTKKSKSTYELLFETFKDVACENDIELKVEI